MMEADLQLGPRLPIRPVIPLVPIDVRPPAGINPFPGLRPFQKHEEHLFFGREKQIDALLDRLAATRFLAVVGTSGSGKSSLVNCGLRPALYRGVIGSAGTQWRIVQFRPGNRPIIAMAAALAEKGVLYDEVPPGPFTLTEVIESTLRLSKLGLLDVAGGANLRDDVNLLVVVDQFEELFRFQDTGGTRRDVAAEVSDEATAFVNLLLEPREHTCRIYVVLTMRSDFLGECAQFYGLPEAINRGQYLVPRMTREERRRAIAGPAGVGGADVDTVLLTRLVNDVGGNPDQLSILQHALNRTWARWKKDGSTGPLTLTHYQDIGTMAHALDQDAEEAYAELVTPSERRICEHLFKALTDKASDARGVRRPTSFEMLCHLTGATVDDLTKVIDGFRQPNRSFLMPPYPEPLTPETIIDISHESLMRVWDRLRIWTDEEARSAATYRRLSETTALQAAGTANLWSERDLASALAWRDEVKPDVWWAERYAPGFRAAMDFLLKSAAAEEARRRREIDQALNQAQTEARHARFTAWLFLSLIVAIVAGGIVYRNSVITKHKFEDILRNAEKKKVEDSARLSAQLAQAQVLNSQLVALQSFAAGPQHPADDQKIHQSFDALARISAITATAPAEHRSSVTIKYYRKPTDSQKLANALQDLGFAVSEETAHNPRETNCIWYGSAVAETDVKLVALAVIRAGLDLRGVQPQTNPSAEARSIQVGHNPRLEDQPAFATDVVSRLPIAQLRRTEVEAKANVTGVITKLDPTRLEGWINAAEGPVYFRFSPEPETLKVGDRVTFTVYYGKRMYAQGVKSIQTPPPQTAPQPPG
jgi:hypothetical protein